jgi:PAS domain S-box-containing protein
MLQQLRVAPGTLVVAAAWQAYAAELGATDLAAISRWGDVKYVGLVLLPPAWFAFAALFAGRGSWVNGRNLALLAIHPLVMLLLLANTATHDLVRWYPPGAAADPDAVAAPGPLFWPHLVYSGMVMWGSLVLDPLHRVVDANPPAERLLGLPVADAIGRPLAELLPEAAEAVRNPPTGANGLPEEVIVTREGATRRYEPTVVAMPDRQGPPIGWLVVLRDVTEHHRTLRSLRQLDEQRRSLLERVVTSQEQERRQVAGDIHDDAIQAMVAVSLQLQALGGRLRDPRSTELLARLAATATESVGRLRQLVFELRPPLLDEVGLAAAIGQYAIRAGELAGFVAQVSDESAGELPDELRVVAYRIVQEALANVRAHAKASRVAVRLEEVDGGLLARVSDDGIGFLPGLVERRPAGHLGLISMREQATMAGGWCRVASAPGMGTTVEVWIPRPKPESE